MSFEQMQSTMQFIVEQQAQHAVLMHKNEERVGLLEAAFVTLTELARNVDERMASLAEHLKTQSEILHAYLQAQSEDFYARLAASKEDLDTNLAASREEFDRHLLASAERSRVIDQTLARLSDLVERNVRWRKGEL